MIKLHCIASGSKGNACVIYNDETTILIDCGICKKRLVEGLNEINKSISDINYAFFTHDHSDHIKGEQFINKELKYSVLGVLDLDYDHVLKVFSQYNFGTFNICVLKTSHDATNSCGYLINDSDSSLVYITDTGYIPKKTLDVIKNKDLYFIESNYDDYMLQNSNRPRILIERISSKHGHLSNYDSVRFMSKVIGDKTKEIILAHLSEECNTEELALKTYINYFEDKKIDNSKIVIKCAKQYRSIDL